MSATPFTCFRCNDGHTPLYCLNCADVLLGGELAARQRELNEAKAELADLRSQVIAVEMYRTEEAELRADLDIAKSVIEANDRKEMERAGNPFDSPQFELRTKLLKAEAALTTWSAAADAVLKLQGPLQCYIIKHSDNLKYENERAGYAVWGDKTFAAINKELCELTESMEALRAARTPTPKEAKP